uniref:Nanos-type domain-containing protein n=1 Tax=viral metagenome TaxID=1070528 RepID=A0A6C0LDF4_9ZZZZ
MSYAKKSVVKNPILCGFCRKAGRVVEAQEHSLKNKNGNVCCPFLAKVTCAYCEKTGHTTTRCAEKIKATKIERELNRYCDAIKKQKKAPQEPVKEQIKKPANVFACLYESDGDSPRSSASERPSCCSPRQKKAAAMVFSVVPATANPTPTADDPYPLVGVTKVIATYCGYDSDSESDDDDEDPYYDLETAAVDRAERWR